VLPAAILVLGARVLPGGRPGEALARRIEAAAAAAREWPGVPVIACGGRAWDGFVEADVMARALEANGVSVARIARDRTSFTTLENVREGSALARRKGAPSSQALALVTCDWHLPRALAIAEAMRVAAVGVSAGAVPAPLRLRIPRFLHELLMVRVDVRLAARTR
jgi:vancomycin permeability regulator SanA